MSNSEIDALYYRNLAAQAVGIVVLIAAGWAILHYSAALKSVLSGLSIG